jgi:hypothetical protein
LLPLMLASVLERQRHDSEAPQRCCDRHQPAHAARGLVVFAFDSSALQPRFHDYAIDISAPAG